MGKINVLDKHLAELIAAGEVVERPSSVIKELVENSIDSGATSVTVEIQNGGITMMRVTDNGSGIMRDDVRNAFLRHATSKVKVKDDLDAIGTLGFRGEALASICAVARVDLLTKAKEEDIGTHYKIEGGDELLLEDAGCPNGTTFVIRDIFFNTPARMKYLKKNVTESTAVAAVVDKIALSHSDVAITLIRDGRQTLVTSGDGNEKNCVYSVLGRDFSNNSVRVDYELGGIGVHGFVTKPQFSRASRSMQNFFINGRFVKSLTAMAALEEACKGMVMVGKFPGCVLNITIPYGLVDVNVHPAKIEVRFANERPVFEAVYHGVKSALINGDTVKQFKMNTAQALDNLVDKSVVQKPFTMSQYNIKKIENTPVIRPSANPDKKSLKVYSSVLENPTDSGKGDTPKKVVLNDPCIDVIESKIKPVRRPLSQNIDIDIDEESAFGTTAKKYNSDRIAVGNSTEVKRTDIDNSDIDCENIENSRTEISDKSHDKSANSASEKSDLTSEAARNISDNSHDSKHSTGDIPQEEIKPLIPDEEENLPDDAVNLGGENENDNSKEEIKPLTDVSGDSVKFIGEAFMTYIIIERNNELVLIDKHALHERIIYEKLRKEQGKKYAQYLLEPVALSLSKPQYNAILENKEVMSESGFEIDDFGGSTILVRSAPSFIGAFDVAATVEEMAEHILDNKQNIESEYTDWLYHNIACRSAVKGGDKSSPQELIDLYMKMGEDPSYRYCPHGRPTSMVMTRYQIEKQFGRV